MADATTSTHIAWTMVAPFAAILLGIAFLPLTRPRWWSQNANKALFVALIALPTSAYLAAVEHHLLIDAATDYASFIILIAALYVVCGCVLVEGLSISHRATPFTNSAILAAGAALASFIGTTGASMLLVRPFLAANSARKKTAHLTLFFIFVVANAGGLLTPLGDPPLFLGFLRGVPFTWTFKLLPVWIFVNLTLIGLFFLIDRARARREHIEETEHAPFRIEGGHNLILLGAIVAATALLPPIWREAAMIAAAALAYFTTREAIRLENAFTAHPIGEVAILFAGIFITMQPALALLRAHGANMGLSTPAHYFFATGALSSVLDNAPTYVAFFTIARSFAAEHAGALVAGVPEPLLVAISLGAVLMGANTYLGNGPNFMIKSIADDEGMATPSFFGYSGAALLILGPLWVAVALLFIY